jgi:hypothetical protein
MSFQQSSFGNFGCGVPERTMVIPSMSRQAPSPFAHANCVSPVKASRRGLFSPPTPAALVSPSTSISHQQLMDMVHMEEIVASSMATRLAFARLQAQQRQQQAFEMFALQQQQCQMPRLVSPIKHQRPRMFSESESLQGLELLHSAASLTPKAPVTPQPPSSPTGGASSASSVDSIPALLEQTTGTQAAIDHSSLLMPSFPPHRAPESPARNRGLVYIDIIAETDILCGRGGKSNHHTGNKRYRQVVGNMKYMYQRCPAKTLKTDLSRAIVEHCCSYGARFVKRCEKTNRYYILTMAEARKKTSQALRETKALKWTL